MKFHALVAAAALLLPGFPAQAADSTTDIQLLGINDFHSGMPSSFLATPDGPIEAGGAEYLAAQFDRLQKENPRNTLRLSSGDNISSAALPMVALHDEPGIQALSMMRLDASSVGNHEFDEGLAELRRMQNGGCHPVDGCMTGNTFKGASFPYLGANIVDKATGKPAFDPYLVKELDGVKVGIIGVTHKNSLWEAPAPKPEIEGVDEAETVNKYVAELKDKGVHTIVVLIHQGGGQAGGGYSNDCNNLTGAIKPIVEKFDPEVDAVLSAHTHNTYNCVVNGIPVTQTTGYGREITQVKLKVDRASGNPVSVTAKNVPVTHDIRPDERVLQLKRKTAALGQELLDRPVGMIAGDLTAQRNAAGESTIQTVLSDARLAATSPQDKGGAQIALTPPYGGSIGGDLIVSPTGNDVPNLVTHGEALRVQQFGNYLTVMTLSGAQLEQLLEQQWCGQDARYPRVFGVSAGFTYTYDAAKAPCDRVDPATMKLNGTVIDPGADYRVAMNSFIASGGDAFKVPLEGRDRVEKVRDIEAFESYLRAKSPVAPPALNRITRLH
ncbi:MAG: bifunctional metallophosphatase/5'-nucleotidase [Nonomuraea sp.]|nr:bifunctional metallophosphatase/5'-nucleotidase [Nonomuraea sp.]